MRIGLDAMGGDHAPREMVRGAIEALREDPGLEVVLVGDRAVVETEIDQAGYKDSRLLVEHAPEKVLDDENPLAALRRKARTSVGLASEMVGRGELDGMVSAGNTGAAVAAGIFNIRLLEGVRRAGIATFLPTVKGSAIVIDVGANIRCKPEHLFQYGVMASIYAKYILDKPEPTIAVLNIGTEEGKGTDLVKETRHLFAEADVNFIGNLEGNQIYEGKADVVVCEGFVGNALLKVSEGLAEAIFVMLGREYMKSPALTADQRQNVVKSLEWLRSRTDYQEYGGAPLLGVRGVSMIAHGRSSARAIASALRATRRNIELKIPERITGELQRIAL